ncbi:MAG: hypothetical protein KKF44_04525 [Nanoarchaeota archaeon]|nr:hypothetical protein [Nanoarchaeota archaeon]
MNEIKKLKKLRKKTFFSEKRRSKGSAILIAAAALFLIIGLVLFSMDFLGIKNRITGRAELDTSVLIIEVTQAYCDFTIESGWNLISIPCTADVTAVDEVFESVEDNIISIHGFTGDVQDTWLAYNPSLPAWVVQDLTDISRKGGYWINMQDQAQFSLNRSTATPNYIAVSPGWNLVGYPTLASEEINQALSTLQPNYNLTVIHMANETSDLWKEYSWDPSVSSDQDLIYADPYYGYWIYMTDSDTWVIDW